MNIENNSHPSRKAGDDRAGMVKMTLIFLGLIIFMGLALWLIPMSNPA